MFKKLTCLAAAISALSVTGVSHAELTANSENKEFVPLPINALALTTGLDGQTFFVSENGRFIIQGVMFDTWRKKEIRTLDDAKSTQNYSLSDIGVERSELAYFTFGSGRRMVDIFVDPNCPYCKSLLQEISRDKSVQKTHQFNVILAPIMGLKSQVDAADIYCATKTENRLKALMTGDMGILGGRQDNCNLDKIQQTLTLASIVGVTSVPFMIRDDGTRTTGKPLDVKSWLLTSNTH
jgi:thiol:disulfide interchange protein DsbC